MINEKTSIMQIKKDKKDKSNQFNSYFFSVENKNLLADHNYCSSDDVMISSFIIKRFSPNLKNSISKNSLERLGNKKFQIRSGMHFKALGSKTLFYSPSPLGNLLQIVSDRAYCIHQSLTLYLL